MLSFCEEHSLGVPNATKRDEKGACGLRELTTPCKDKTVTQTSAARHTFSYKWQQMGIKWGYQGHGNCRPSPKQGHQRFQDTGFRILSHRKPRDRDILVGETYTTGEFGKLAR